MLKVYRTILIKKVTYEPLSVHAETWQQLAQVIFLTFRITFFSLSLSYLQE